MAFEVARRQIEQQHATLLQVAFGKFVFDPFLCGKQPVEHVQDFIAFDFTKVEQMAEC